MVADGLVEPNVLVAQRGGLAPGYVAPLCGGKRREPVLHALQRPAQVDRRGAGGEQAGTGGLQMAFGSPLCESQRDAIGGGGANQGRAANAHDRNGFGRVFEGVQRAERQAMRQQGLVDDFDAAVVRQRADGSGGGAVNVHVSLKRLMSGWISLRSDLSSTIS